MEAEKRRIEQQKKIAEAEKKRIEAEKRIALNEKRRIEQAKRKAEEERKRSERAKRRAEEQKRLALAARAKAEAERKAAEEAQRRQEEKLAMAQALALEQQEQANATARLRDRLRAEYIEHLRASVERNWIRPVNANRGLKCTIRVSQIPGGEVVRVRIVKSSGNIAFDRSVETAVWNASPLPQPKDSVLFDREIIFEFDPEV